MIKVANSYAVSKKVIDLVVDCLNDDTEFTNRVDGTIDVFFNGRERGLLLQLDTKESVYGASDARSLVVWVFEVRTSDQIGVVYGLKSDAEFENTHTYSERAYRNFKMRFGCCQYNPAANFILALIKDVFDTEDDTEYNKIVQA